MYLSSNRLHFVKLSLRFLVLFVAFSTLILAQGTDEKQDWHWQYPAPQGNTLHDLCILDSNSAIAAGDLGTIVKTIDKGENWSVTHHAGSTSCDLYGIQFLDTLIGWAVGRSNLEEIGTFETNSLINTTDGGKSWQKVEVNTTLPLSSVWFVDPDTGLAVGEDGIVLRTTDGGKSWNTKKIDYYMNPYRYLDVFVLQKILFTDKMNGWIVGYGYDGNQIYRTTDCGRTWQWYEKLLSPKIYTSLNDISAADNNNIYVVGDNGTFLKSSDGGITWVYQNLYQKYKNRNYRHLYSVCFTDSLTGWISGGDYYTLLIKTTDGGRNWYEIDSSLNKGHLYKIKFSNKNNGWVIGTSGMIFRTTDAGSNWSFFGQRKPIRLFSISFSDKNNGWAVGDSGLILCSSDGGNSWYQQAYNPELMLQSVYSQNNNTAWVVGGSHFASGNEVDKTSILMYTTDGGKNWTRRQDLPKTYWFSAVYFQNDSTGWITGTEGTLLKTNDKGNSWRQMTINKEGTLDKIQFINDSTGWFSYYSGNKLMKTTDRGINWKAQLVDSTLLIHSFYFINDSIGWATGDYVILRTTNGGDNWRRCNAPSALYRSIYFSNLTTGWSIGSDVHYRSVITKTTDGGDSWTQLNSAAEGILTNSFFLDDNTGWAVGDGIIKTLTGGGVITNVERVFYDNVNKAPIQITLAQNYPNPFNSSTTIQYRLKKPGLTLLIIYNLLGEVVNILINKWQTEGDYKINWSAGELPSGIYFYELRSGGYSKINKMILLK